MHRSLTNAIFALAAIRSVFFGSTVQRREVITHQSHWPFTSDLYFRKRYKRPNVVHLTALDNKNNSALMHAYCLSGCDLVQDAILCLCPMLDGSPLNSPGSTNRMSVAYIQFVAQMWHRIFPDLANVAFSLWHRCQCTICRTSSNCSASRNEGHHAFTRTQALTIAPTHKPMEAPRSVHNSPIHRPMARNPSTCSRIKPPALHPRGHTWM